MNKPLHPNLARIAASYDDVQARASRGEISVDQARSEVSLLVARDDEGVMWSIDPSSGQWMRRTLSGQVVPDSPPTYGVATPTAHDLTMRPSGSFDPNSRLVFSDVDERALLGESSLRGATRREPQVEAASGGGLPPALGVFAVLVAAVLTSWMLFMR